MFKQKRFILKVLLYTIGLTSIFGLDKAWGMSWLGEKKIEAPLLRVSFCSSGDMLGSMHGMSVTAVNKDYALITTSCFCSTESVIYQIYKKTFH